MSDDDDPPGRILAPGRTARIHVYDIERGHDAVVFASDDVLVEAPNWTLDGAGLVVNGDGALWMLDLDAGAGNADRPALRRIAHEGLPPINNDHVLDPDGEHVFMSAQDGHIYRGALSGGAVRRVTSDDGVWHFLHGVSPDGRRLAYVRMTDFAHPGVLAIMPTTGGPTTIVDTGDGHIDGPEWSPDGEWILFNTERWATRPGHAQLARIRDDAATGESAAAGHAAERDSAADAERLLASGTVDWFPHLAPDGRHAVYLEFPPGTEGHPADLPVHLVVVATDDWAAPLARIPVPGGQGTINVNSWAPDARRFAYVSYPVAGD